MVQRSGRRRDSSGATAVLSCQSGSERIAPANVFGALGWIVAAVLVSASVSNCAAATVAPSEHVIWLGPGPFALESGCLLPQEGPHPTPLPFPRRVLEDEMRHELMRLGVPLRDPGSAQHAKRPLYFGACVWKQENGDFQYTLTLTGPWPEDQLGDVEDVSYWPHAMGTVPPGRLRATLLRETRQVARDFMRLVRIGNPSKR
jgi:hypothetical protein